MAKVRNLRPNSRSYRFGNLDGRSGEGRLLRRFRQELIDHVGGEPTVPQRAIIERCAWLQLHIALLDTKFADGTFSEYDSKVYLSWSNSLGRLLGRLGEPRAAKPMDALEYGRLLDARRAAGEAA